MYQTIYTQAQSYAKRYEYAESEPVDVADVQQRIVEEVKLDFQRMIRLLPQKPAYQS
jgi:hypothetical protein